MRCGQRGEWWFAAAGFASALGAVYVLAQNRVVGEAAWTALVVGAFLCVLAGMRLHQPSARGPWVVLAAALGLLALGNILTHPAWGSPQELVLVSEVGQLIAFPLLGLAALLLVRRQNPAGDREGAIDGLIVLVALTTILSGAVFTPEAMQANSPVGRVLLVVAPVTLAGVTVAGLRLVFAGARVPSTYLLAGASASALAGQVLRTFALSTATYERGAVEDLLIAGAYAAAGLAALHPSMVRLTQPSNPADRGLTHARVAILGMSLITGPVTLLIDRRAEILPITGSLVVSLLVLWRLWRLILEREEVRDEMRRRAVNDALTGLPNRAELLSRLGRSTEARHRDGTSTAVLFIDLDGFKRVNDHFGHQVGDELLTAVARRLQEVQRTEDLLVRLAGDEFVIVCDDLEEAAVLGIAERVLEALTTPFALGDVEVGLGASVGVTLRAEPGGSAEALLGEADAAMYQAKQRGGGIELYGRDLGRRLLRRRQLERDLLPAVRGGELHLLYRPVVELVPPPGSAPRTVGVEALVRWPHPQLGVIEPLELMPVADSSGLIVPLGNWMLREACMQLASWRPAPGAAPLRLFFTVSPRQLAQTDLALQIGRILDETGITPDRLVLEVTETTIFDDQEEGVRRLHELKDLGAALALDDFGTGYSSLTRLKRLPFDLIKMHATFVERIEPSPSDQAIVGGVVGIARAHGARVLGKGIEHAGQARVLARLGCDLGQGPHLGPAVDAERMARALDEEFDAHDRWRATRHV